MHTHTYTQGDQHVRYQSLIEKSVHLVEGELSASEREGEKARGVNGRCVSECLGVSECSGCVCARGFDLCALAVGFGQSGLQPTVTQANTCMSVRVSE